MHQTGPVISFLPILLMGVLFGLAMDYEVFLVSRMREDFVHGGDARAAIENGFAASARVVVAAAVIMFAVFAAFVPEGEGAIKTIAFALAAGVFVDAFVVRMTLVPAVMSLLGRSAWWLPRWIDRRLPLLRRRGRGAGPPGRAAPTGLLPVMIISSTARTCGWRAGISHWRSPCDHGRSSSSRVRPHRARLPCCSTLAGRMQLLSGRLKVAGLVLPEQARTVRARTGVVDCRTVTDARAAFRAVQKARPQVIFVDHADVLVGVDDRAALASLLDEVAVGGSGDRAVVLATRDRESVADLIPTRYSYLSLSPQPDPALDRTA